jgi:hypothetical protein
VTDERRPRPNNPPRQPPVSDEEFRRALERETDLSLREDPQRRRFYQSGDLPRSGLLSDDPTGQRHHRGEGHCCIWRSLQPASSTRAPKRHR